ncbi:porin [Rugamonas sp. CCM 8940]|uniref:porin n=1 Tax=Rugamonas sp. CCM 8940 TaxID=2765359 RepID=UPI0018F2CF44|nr:porin [Rugamonas sp. CCM 8940]MBJ7313868.1 porin [Rugamonas sp. CCM 8940]
MKTISPSMLALPLFCCAATSAMAQAQAQAQPQTQQNNVRLYGLVDVYAASASGGSGVSGVGGGRSTLVNNGGMTTSYWGVAGTEQLGDGLSAQFALESFFRADTGEAGRVPGEALFSRAAYVGLAGNWGTLRLGRLPNPLFVATSYANPFGFSTRLSPFVDQLWSVPFGSAIVGDTGWNNALAYLSPTVGGVSLTLQGNLGEGAATSYGNNKAAVLRYTGAALALTAAAQRVSNGLNISAAAPSQSVYFAAASYDFNIVKLYAGYNRANTEVSGRRTRTGHLGLSLPAGAGSWMLAWARSRESSALKAAFHRDTASAGYDHNLSLRTDLYSVFLHDKLSNAAAGNTLALGLRHKF